MRNLRTGCFSLIAVSLVLTVDVTAQVTRPAIGKVPKRVAVAPPRLTVIQMSGPELVVVDVGGDGVDLSGGVRTSLVTGSAAGMRWVKAESDDAMVLLDAAALRAGGVSLMTAAGEPLDGLVVPRGGLRMTDASGSSFAASAGLELLARLDANRDGRIDKSDPAWSATTLFRDRNADGTIGAGELTGAEEVLQSLNVAASGAESTDGFGTTHVPGVAHLRDGTAVAIVHARPATIQ